MPFQISPSRPSQGRALQGQIVHTQNRPGPGNAAPVTDTRRRIRTVAPNSAQAKEAPLGTSVHPQSAFRAVIDLGPGPIRPLDITLHHKSDLIICKRSIPQAMIEIFFLTAKRPGKFATITARNPTSDARRRAQKVHADPVKPVSDRTAVAHTISVWPIGQAACERSPACSEARLPRKRVERSEWKLDAATQTANLVAAVCKAILV